MPLAIAVVILIFITSLSSQSYQLRSGESFQASSIAIDENNFVVGWVDVDALAKSLNVPQQHAQVICSGVLLSLSYQAICTAGSQETGLQHSLY